MRHKEIAVSVATNIRRLRLDAGLSQEELAKKLGVSRSTVTQWESGWSQPRMGMVQKVADVFGITASAVVAEAKDGIVALDNTDGAIEIPASVAAKHPNAKAHVVNDNDMGLVIPRGYIAVYDPDLKPVNGRIALAQVGKRLVIRRWYRGGNTLMLVAESPEPLDDIVLTANDDAEVRGVVVWAQPADEL